MIQFYYGLRMVSSTFKLLYQIYKVSLDIFTKVVV